MHQLFVVFAPSEPKSVTYRRFYFHQAYACYWIPSALFSLIMNALFLTRGFRRLCGIPTAPLDMDLEDSKWKETKAKQESMKKELPQMPPSPST
jgi:hypothetical protein